MKWITIKLMQYQLKKAKKQEANHSNDIVKKAFTRMIDVYENTIGFLKVQ